MNAPTPTRLLRVSETPLDGNDIAILGKDIRIDPEKIASYCVTQYNPVFEDLATLVESMAYWDRREPRKRSTGWSRVLTLQIPVYEKHCFSQPRIQAALEEAAWFLTGDHWSFEFVGRQGPAPGRQDRLKLSTGAVSHVIPFSDGLDSFAQAQLSAESHGRSGVMLIRSGLSRSKIFQDIPAMRVPRRFGGVRLRETTYRTRPLVFFTLAAIGASITNAKAVVIGESGQGAIGPACMPFADEWWFRSAHPAFIKRWSSFLSLVLGRSVEFEQPQLWLTKGEVLNKLKQADLIEGWNRTVSCATRPLGRYTRRACGVCGGCLLRTVAAHAADLPQKKDEFAFDISAADAVASDIFGNAHPMTAGERAVAVRAVVAMDDFARLTENPQKSGSIIREAELINPKDAPDAYIKLTRLLAQHRYEWYAFLDRLPKNSWLLQIVREL